VVSDLEQGRPIWFGGNARSQADIDQFFAFLGVKHSASIDMAVIDMWRTFRNSLACRVSSYRTERGARVSLKKRLDI